MIAPDASGFLAAMKGHATKVIVPEKGVSARPDRRLTCVMAPRPLNGHIGGHGIADLHRGRGPASRHAGPHERPAGDGRRVSAGAWRQPSPLAELASYQAAVLAAGLLLEPLFERGTGHPDLVQAGAALYLVLLAVRLWRQGHSGEAQRLIGPRQIAATTLLNPKGLIIALGLMPEAAWGQTDLLLAHLAVLAVLTPLFGGLWLSAGAMGAMAAGTQAQHLLPRAAAIALCLFAGLLARAAWAG